MSEEDIPISQEEDERLYRWKHLRQHRDDIVTNAVAMAEATDGLAKLSAQMRLQAAVRNFIRMGGKVGEVV